MNDYLILSLNKSYGRIMLKTIHFSCSFENSLQTVTIITVTITVIIILLEYYVIIPVLTHFVCLIISVL